MMNKPFFKKPVWLKPSDINRPKYWIRLAILVTIVLAILQLFHLARLDLITVIVSLPSYALGDIISETVLQ